MKKQLSVLEILFSQVRAEMLRVLFAPPHKERYVRELMRMSGLTLSTIQDELRKLTVLALVTSRSNRYHRFYRVNRGHPLFSALVHIVAHSERTSHLDRSKLHRPRTRQRSQKRYRMMAPDRPTKWNLFPKRGQT